MPSQKKIQKAQAKHTFVHGKSLGLGTAFGEDARLDHARVQGRCKQVRVFGSQELDQLRLCELGRHVGRQSRHHGCWKGRGACGHRNDRGMGSIGSG